MNSLASVLSSKTVALGLSRYIILAASQMLGDLSLNWRRRFSANDE